MATNLISLLLSFALPFVQVNNYDLMDCAGSGAQNWGLDLNESSLFCANSNGLVYFNGNDWSILDNNHSSTLRDVLVDGERCYYCGTGEIGYWEREQDGKFVVHSFDEQIDSLGLSSETFWHIIQTSSGHIYFHSFGTILCMDGTDLRVISQHVCYNSFLKYDDSIYATGINGGLYELQKDEFVKIGGSDLSTGLQIVYMFPDSDGTKLAIASNGSVLRLENGLPSVASLKNLRGEHVAVDCALRLDNGNLAIGTLGNGILITDPSFATIAQISSPQLQSNSVHSISASEDGCLWAALDYGISSVDLDSNQSLWKTVSEVGAFYSAVNFSGDTYIATSSGLYRSGTDTEQIKGLFPLKLSNCKGHLMCGTTSSTYDLSRGSDDIELGSINGARQFEYFSDNGDEFLLLRSYGGIFVLKYDKSAWKMLYWTSGTTDYKDFLVENSHTVWVIKPGAGLQRLNVEDSFRAVTSTTDFGYSASDNKGPVYLLKSDGRIVFATKSGLFLFNALDSSFEPIPISAEVKDYLNRSVSVSRGRNNCFWIITKDELVKFSFSNLSPALVSKSYLRDNRTMIYDESVPLSETDSLLFVSTCSGTLVIKDRPAEEGRGNTLSLESLTYCDKNKNVVFASSSDGVYRIPHEASDISLKMSTGISSKINAIAWRESGSDWSGWQESGIIGFTTLKTGLYHVTVRNYYGEECEIRIKVLSPRGAQPWMIVMYVLLLIISTAVIVFSAIRKRQKMEVAALQKKSYEELQETVGKLRVQLKSRVELLVSQTRMMDSMSAEIDNLKKSLGNDFPKESYLRMISIIDEGREKTHEFETVENYFVDVHFEFMKKMQSLHPSLTTSELKFCCLLRSNLSTKEIAQIMAIEPRSVDLKKYRLKSHLGLGKDDSLMHYILKI